eukprot:5759099-Alexandrium_andersonii.AAC.1
MEAPMRSASAERTAALDIRISPVMIAVPVMLCDRVQALGLSRQYLFEDEAMAKPEAALLG